jgi:glycosyltransferase involved in cell wall biosynthesis
MKICHISTLHNRYDNRIFQKELKTLGKYYDPNFIVADGNGDENIDGINIFDIGLRSNSRLKRSRLDSNKALKKALEIDADLYHIHDPELLRIAIKLKRKSKIVIFDSHEDVPNQIFTKTYIPVFFRKIVSAFFKNYERKLSRKLDLIISATPIISDKFIKYGAKSISVCNYPIVDEDFKSDINLKSDLVYIGGISEERGILNMLDAIEDSNLKLNLAGRFFNAEIEIKAKSHVAWEKVNWKGFLDNNGVKELLQKSSVGLVLLKDYQSYQESLPVKMFEYMHAGIPVIASNFPMWKDIIEKNNCGLCVDPVNIAEIKKAIKYLGDNPALAKEMGQNARKMILDNFNWNHEADKLVKAYKNLS